MDFVRTNILEIDELSSSIVMLSENVADSSSKLAQIVSIAELSIGAFEYNKITGKTFCTAGLFDTLALPPERDVYMKNDEFKKKLDTLKERVGEQENDAGDVLFSIMLDEGREKWIKYKRVVDDTKILGVVIDVTNEITEKRKLEYERDHDTLTNLYNRSAFHAIVTKLIQDPHEVGVAALIMLDLDNLKYINDTYGHNCGDMYIQCTADALRKCKTYRATVSRMSGDEFFVFLYGYKSLEELRIVIQKVKETLQNTVF
ncbi:MAG: diguanylate cyclase, partial [Clostridia bacterium]